MAGMITTGRRLVLMGVDLSTLVQQADTRIVLVVMDGLGGYATVERGSELEEAKTPNLDRLGSEGAAGFGEPAAPGITPGPGPGHLGPRGYDPPGAPPPPGPPSAPAPRAEPQRRRAARRA